MCIDADIDTLCVVPNVIFRSDFFQEMLTLLRKTPEITHITVGFYMLLHVNICLHFKIGCTRFICPSDKIQI